eukprot:809023-Pyramimonas_sp.AAC.1
MAQELGPIPHGACRRIGCGFGDSVLDDRRGVHRLQDNKWVWQFSTPWAKQLKEDLDALANADSDIKSWYDERISDFEIFCPGTSAWQHWTATDTTALRSIGVAELDAVRGDGGETEGEEEEENDVTKPYWCDCMVQTAEGTAGGTVL